MSGIVDVHHHLSPPEFVARIGRRTPLLPSVTGWAAGKSLADMDEAGVATAMLSVTTPDVLKADGVLMFTSDTQWLGDAQFAPVMEELNRRHAIVSVHPTTHACCGNLIQGVPDTVIEYGTDTTRTIASLVFSGASRRYPDIRFVFSHAGSTMPFLIERFRFLAASPGNQGKFPDGVDAELRRFFYDTAQASNPAAMGALRQIVPVEQIVFGTDFPYRTSAEHVRNLFALSYPPAEQRAIERGNAARLMPRLGAA